MENVIVRYLNMPYGTKGLVSKDCEGVYNIYINTKYSANTQAETLTHELNHIEDDDFDNSNDIEEVENL